MRIWERELGAIKSLQVGKSRKEKNRKRKSGWERKHNAEERRKMREVWVLRVNK